MLWLWLCAPLRQENRMTLVSREVAVTVTTAATLMTDALIIPSVLNYELCLIAKIDLVHLLPVSAVLRPFFRV